MKKINLIVALSFMTYSLYAQEQKNDTIERHHFNHWSIEFNLGQNKPIKPFANGYYASKPDTYFYFNGVEHYDIGVRYMFSNVFGAKLDFAYDDIKDQDGSGSLDFQTKQFRLGLQGVANLGRLLRFETFTHRFGLLAHGGLQVSILRPQMGINEGNYERDGGFMYGLTPQFRLTNWLVLTGDFTGLQNFRQHLNWDGSFSDKENSLSGTIFNTSLGVTVYLGNTAKKHADWYIPKEQTATLEKENSKRIAEIETLMNDTDRDGVLDYLDQENNTPTGVAVDTRGKFIDINRNGVPDELEQKEKGFNQNINQYDSNSSLSNSMGGNINVLKSLIEKGCVNVFYDLNEEFPNIGSTNSVYQILLYLKSNPDSKIKLTGFADFRGNEQSNKNLSKNRATNLKSLFVASGINSDRISIDGLGVDKSYPSTKIGLDLARRVSVEIIK